ncbi:MAG: acyltransferase [Dehalococcoidia bacterium]|nr:acyltransferase [Dehalococcoidia bacterium]
MPSFERARSELTLAGQQVRLRLRLANLICGALPEYSCTTARAAVYRRLGMRLGERVAFFGAVSVTGAGPNPYPRLSVGDDSMVSVRVLFNLEAEIRIGRNVQIAQFVRMYTAHHKLGPSERRFTPEFTPKPIVIEDGVYVATGSIVLPGVTIGRGAVVSANTVVSRDVPPNSLVTGVPARVIKELT